MAGRVKKTNMDILQQCREQIGLNLSEVEKKLRRLLKLKKEHKNLLLSN